MDEQGFCRIVGRAKDMIIRGGENIYPAELEDFFHTHPQVQDVQVRHPALRSSGETPRGRGHGWGCGWGCLPLSLTLEGGGSEGQPDGGGNLCLHSAQEGGEDHGGGDQGFLQREGGGLIPASPPPAPSPVGRCCSVLRHPLPCPPVIPRSPPPQPGTPPSLMLDLPLVCRSPTLRFLGTSCL